MEIVEKVLNGDKRAVARLISMIENGDQQAVKALSALHAHTGNAHIIGVTGPPGVGKSTLVDKLAKSYRELNKKIGIIAVDPSSPFTGGAILGDRVRMNDLNTDPGVFIRSMGTRGHLGGLARSTADVIKVLDAYGMDKIIVETVGAGQSEVEIASYAHTTLLVEMPGLGDDIQTIKAGIMEIGDIFVINKADRAGIDRTEAEIRTMLSLHPEEKPWLPPVMRTVAINGDGIQELRDEIEKHLDYLQSSGQMKLIGEERAREDFIHILKANVTKYIIERSMDQKKFDELLSKILSKQIDPYSAARELTDDFENSL